MMSPSKPVKGEKEWEKLGGRVERKEYKNGRVEAYYIASSGKRLRSWRECERFMQGISPKRGTPSKKQKSTGKSGDNADADLKSSAEITSRTVRNGEDSVTALKDAAAECTPMVEDSPARASVEDSIPVQKVATLCTPKEEYPEYPDAGPSGQFSVTGVNSITEHTPSLPVHPTLAPTGEDSRTDYQNVTKCTPGGKHSSPRDSKLERWIELGGSVEKKTYNDGRVRCLYVAANGKKFYTWKECEKFLDDSSECATGVEQPPHSAPGVEDSFRGYDNATAFTPRGAHNPGEGYKNASECSPSQSHHPQGHNNTTACSPSEEYTPAVPSGKVSSTAQEKAQRWAELGGRVERNKRRDGRVRILYVAPSGKKFRSWKDCEKFFQGSTPQCTPSAKQPPAAAPGGEDSCRGYTSAIIPSEAHHQTEGCEDATESTPSQAHHPTGISGGYSFTGYNNATESTPTEEHATAVPSGKTSLTADEKAKRWAELGGSVEKSKRSDGRFRNLYVTPSGRKLRTWKQCEKFIQVSTTVSTPKVEQSPTAAPGKGDLLAGYNNATECIPSKAHHPTSPVGEDAFRGIKTEDSPIEAPEPIGSGGKGSFVGYNAIECTPGKEHAPVVPSGRNSLKADERAQRWAELGGSVEKQKRKDGRVRCLYVAANGKKFRTWKECEKFLQGSSTGFSRSLEQPPSAVPGGEDSCRGYNNANASSEQQHRLGPSGGVTCTGHNNATECTPTEELRPARPNGEGSLTDEDNARRWFELGGRVERKDSKDGQVRWYFVAANGKKFCTWEECETFLQCSWNEDTPSVEQLPFAGPGGEDAFIGYSNTTECTPSDKHRPTPLGGNDSITGHGNPTQCIPSAENRPSLPGGKDSLTAQEKAQRWGEFGGSVERNKRKDGRIRILYVTPSGKKFRSWKDCGKFMQSSTTECTPSVEQRASAAPVGEVFAGYNNATDCTPSELHPPTVASGKDLPTDHKDPAECNPIKKHPPTAARGEGVSLTGNEDAMECTLSKEHTAGSSGDTAFTGNKRAQRWLKLGGRVEKKERKSGRVSLLYVTPNGEKLNSWRECERFLQVTSPDASSRKVAPILISGEDSGNGPKCAQRWIELGGHVEKKVYTSGRVEFFYVTATGERLRSWKECERFLQANSIESTSTGRLPPMVTGGPSTV